MLFTRNEIKATDPSTVEVLNAIGRSGFTDVQIAKVAGISTNTLTSWRNGTNTGRPLYLEWVREGIARLERERLSLAPGEPDVLRGGEDERGVLRDARKAGV